MKRRLPDWMLAGSSGGNENKRNIKVPKEKNVSNAPAQNTVTNGDSSASTSKATANSNSSSRSKVTNSPATAPRIYTPSQINADHERIRSESIPLVIIPENGDAVDIRPFVANNIISNAAVDNENDVDMVDVNLLEALESQSHDTSSTNGPVVVPTAVTTNAIKDEPVDEAPATIAADPSRTNTANSSGSSNNAPPSLTTVKTEIKTELNDDTATTSTAVNNTSPVPAAVPDGSSGSASPPNAPPDPAAVPSGSTSPSNTLRSSCKFGIKCFRKNPEHRNELAHPGDVDYRRPYFPEPPPGTPACPFGAQCYRRNPEHFRNLHHPPASIYDPKPIPATTGPAQPPPPPAKRRRPKINVYTTVVQAISDDDDDDGDEEDPFINDDSTEEYNPDNDDDEEDTEDF